jgi:cytochrome c biogenesis protein CcdA
MPLDPLGLTFAFTAGVFALFSPCAFPLFPGYISLYLGIDVPVKKAIECGTVCALGLLAVLCAIGLVASVTGSLVFTYIPFLQPVVGLFMILMGLSMIIEISLPSFQPSISARARMTLPLVITTIVVARSRDLLVKKVVRATPILHRISGVALILLGVYLTSSYMASASSTILHHRQSNMMMRRSFQPGQTA